MPRQRRLQVIKKRVPDGTGAKLHKQRRNSVKSGAFATLDRRNIDQRTKLARALKHVHAELINALGGPEAVSPQKQIIISRAVYKLARCVLFESHSLASDEVNTGSDNTYLAWSNSLRRDLESLGLERSERKIMDLRDYIRQVDSDPPSSSAHREVVGAGEGKGE